METYYAASNKNANQTPPTWEKDDKHGPNDTNHSMLILIAWLIAWLVVPGNFAK